MTGPQSDSFGTLRALLQDPRQDAAWCAQLCACLESSYDHDAQVYRAQWLPYMESFSAVWDRVLREVDSLQELERWCEMAPFASFGLRLPKTLDEAGIRELAASPLLERVHSLDTQQNELRERCLEILMHSPALINLRDLDLTYMFLTHQSLQALTESPLAVHLRSLNLRSNRQAVCDGGIEILAQSPQLTRLRHLGLMQCGLDVDDGARLAQSPLLCRLDSLNVYGNTLRDVGVAALVESPNATNLRHIDLGNTYIHGERDGFHALVNSSQLSSLTSLDLRNNYIGSKGVHALTGSPYLQALAHLNLSFCVILDGGVEALARSPHSIHLHSLNLTMNGISTTGALALARSPYLIHLHTLHLTQNNAIGSEGVEALARSEYLHKHIHIDHRYSINDPIR